MNDFNLDLVPEREGELSVDQDILEPIFPRFFPGGEDLYISTAMVVNQA